MPEGVFDIVVVGGGHAGCEAALAAAHLGARTALVTLRAECIAQMSCNPAIGGLAKGQIVREIDALGGWMARVTDATAIQYRLLNRSKGPAVRSPRAQCDRQAYARAMQDVLGLHGGAKAEGRGAPPRPATSQSSKTSCARSSSRAGASPASVARAAAPWRPAPSS